MTAGTVPAHPALVAGIESFEAIGTRNSILTSDPTVVRQAADVARDMLADLDRVASRFREDSEVTALARAAQRGAVTTRVSPLLADYVGAAVRAAELTGGLVDATVGRAVEASGYDADITVVRSRTHHASEAHVRPGAPGLVPGWTRVTLDPSGRTLTLPHGCLLDLGSSAKAHAADRIAARLSDLLPGGFLVNLGGDIAVGGHVPPQGWHVGLEDAAGRIRQVVVIRGQALATSSTQRRAWTVSDRAQHHIIDPRTGRPAEVVWADVTCAGASALEANAASTAAVILGHDAPGWLTAHGIPARLDPVRGVAVTTPGWPAPEVSS